MDVSLSTIAAACFLLAAICTLVARRYRPHPALLDPAEEEISLRHVSARVERFLSAGHPPGSFIVFLTDRIGADGGAGFCQVSIEDDGAGVDHVSTCDENAERREAFSALVQTRGFSHVERQANGVSYLRVATPRSAELCQLILADVFALSDDATLNIIEHAA